MVAGRIPGVWVAGRIPGVGGWLAEFLEFGGGWPNSWSFGVAGRIPGVWGWLAELLELGGGRRENGAGKVQKSVRNGREIVEKWRRSA